jgi:hypothetical protein
MKERRPSISPYPEQVRVFLLGVGNNTEEEKNTFCNQLSETLGISHTLLKRIVDHCPMPLKKNLTWPKARSLARVLKSFGAQILVEVKRDLPPISLEFQNLGSHLLTLESSSLGRNQSGTWSVVGRAKNDTSESLSEVWVLVQLFNVRGEFLTFEEVPLILNPLPPGEVSPFRGVFEEDIPIHKASIAFKNSSGNPLPAIDRRSVQEWVKIEWDEGEEPVLSIDLSISPRPIRFEKPKEELNIQMADPPLREFQPSEPETPRGTPVESQENLKPIPDPFPEGSQVHTPLIPREEDLAAPITFPLAPLPSTRPPQIDPSVFEEASQLIHDISLKREKKEKDSSWLPWIEEFRNSIQTFDQKYPDSLTVWFGEQKSQNELKDPSHSLLTLLVHARFDQMNDTETTLRNTQRVFRLLAKPEIALDEIPVLEGTLFFSGEQWRDLFHRAISKLQQVSHVILEKRAWEASEIGRLILVIPHMSERLSRKAVRWISQLMPEGVEIDFSNHPIWIDASLYRVASRLGIIDPHFDSNQGKSSMGDLKIQTFAKAAFPQDPSKIEAPMVGVGRNDAEGLCLSFHPRCAGCLFETFCPKLYLDFDPSEKGMGRH